uniref:P33 n=1 Tax=Cydia pomonella granulosis virus TaxID=28289 RepID=A0A6B9I6Z5_GVCP|nr:P33 [Cydia pomonella granulovirus]QGZ00022.1 P33 [Cydia pomonella granulovirus]
MLVETQTVLRYKQSFCLFVYRLLDMCRMAPTPELQKSLRKQVLFLYNVLCLMVYNEDYSGNVSHLVDWASSVGSDIKLDAFKDMYVAKLVELKLHELQPAKFVFSFSTIWDSLHLMCLVGDDVVHNRQLFDAQAVLACIKNMKWVFYNVFIVLFCPICAKHYLTVDTFPFEFERVEVALYREQRGEPLQFVEEMNRNQIHKNVLYRNHLLYNSMVFHNHVNSYRPIQHDREELNNFQRMEWSILKSLVGIV